MLHSIKEKVKLFKKTEKLYLHSHQGAHIKMSRLLSSLRPICSFSSTHLYYEERRCHSIINGLLRSNIKTIFQVMTLGSPNYENANSEYRVYIEHKTGFWKAVSACYSVGKLSLSMGNLQHTLKANLLVISFSLKNNIWNMES